MIIIVYSLNAGFMSGFMFSAFELNSDMFMY